MRTVNQQPSHWSRFSLLREVVLLGNAISLPGFLFMEKLRLVWPWQGHAIKFDAFRSVQRAERRSLVEDLAQSAGLAERGWMGRVNLKVAPWSSALTTLMVPPCSSTSSLVSARPRPVP